MYLINILLCDMEIEKKTVNIFAAQIITGHFFFILTLFYEYHYNRNIKKKI